MMYLHNKIHPYLLYHLMLLPHRNKFCIGIKRYNVEISPQRTNSTIIAMEPVWCKLNEEDKIIERLRSFQHLGMDRGGGCEVYGFRAICETLNEKFIFKNQIKLTNIWSNSTWIRVSCGYSRTRHMARTAEVNILRTILGRMGMNRDGTPM